MVTVFSSPSFNVFFFLLLYDNLKYFQNLYCFLSGCQSVAVFFSFGWYCHQLCNFCSNHRRVSNVNVSDMNNRKKEINIVPLTSRATLNLGVASGVNANIGVFNTLDACVLDFPVTAPGFSPRFADFSVGEGGLSAELESFSVSLPSSEGRNGCTMP